MIITSVKTHKITSSDTDIYKILDRYLLDVREKSVIAITSKIVSICEGRIVKMSEVGKDSLIEKESQFYLPRNENPYDVSLTITRNTLVPTAGIDESNGNGFYILWPKDAQKSANEIREYIKKKYKVNDIGVIITDSKTTPLRWGVTAIAIAYSGFKPLKDYIGKEDLFGRKFAFEKMNVIDNLACSAALAMGEGSEQTPIAIMKETGVEFQDENPSKEELDMLKISLQEDLYAPLLQGVGWKKGKG